MYSPLANCDNISTVPFSIIVASFAVQGSMYRKFPKIGQKTSSDSPPLALDAISNFNCALTTVLITNPAINQKAVHPPISLLPGGKSPSNLENLKNVSCLGDKDIFG